MAQVSAVVFVVFTLLIQASEQCRKSGGFRSQGPSAKFRPAPTETEQSELLESASGDPEVALLGEEAAPRSFLASEQNKTEPDEHRQLVEQSCSDLQTCEANVQSVRDRCSSLRQSFLPEGAVFTECEQAYWDVIDAMLYPTGVNQVDDGGYLGCLSKSTPFITEIFKTISLPKCLALGTNWTATSFLFPSVYERFDQQLTAMLAAFPSGSEFNQCLLDYFHAARSCLPMADCCPESESCRLALGLPSPLLTVQTLLDRMIQYTARCQTPLPLPAPALDNSVDVPVGDSVKFVDTSSRNADSPAGIFTR